MMTESGMRIIKDAVNGGGPLISVIVPARDPGRVLKSTLASVYEQRNAAIEIIVVDDGSKENIPALLKPGKASVRLVYVRHQKPRGLSAARNTGLKFSRGEFVVFLDADDLLLPGKIALQAGILSRDKSLAAACSRWKYLYWDGSLSASDGYYSSGAELRWRIFGGNIAPVHAFCFRRSALVKTGGFSTALSACEDWDLLARLIWSGAKLYFHRETTAVYRRHGSTLSSDPARMYGNGLKTLSNIRTLAGRSAVAKQAFEAGFIKLQLTACRRCLSAGDDAAAKQYFLKAVGSAAPPLSCAGGGGEAARSLLIEEVSRKSWSDIKYKNVPKRLSSPGVRKRAAGAWLKETLPVIGILSPHCDDAPLSLSALFASRELQPGPEVFNVFSRSKYTLNSPCTGPVLAVTGARHKEEEAAARRCGYQVSFLGFGEPFVRKGFSSLSDLRDVSRDPGRDGCWRGVVSAMRKLMLKKDRAWLVPLALGGHIDHRIVKLAALKAAADSGARIIGFYEDLPYAAYYSPKEIAAHVKSGCGAAGVKPWILTGSLKYKAGVLKIYASQIGIKEMKAVAAHWARTGGERLWLTPFGENLLRDRTGIRHAR